MAKVTIDPRTNGWRWFKDDGKVPDSGLSANEESGITLSSATEPLRLRWRFESAGGTGGVSHYGYLFYTLTSVPVSAGDWARVWDAGLNSGGTPHFRFRNGQATAGQILTAADFLLSGSSGGNETGHYVESAVFASIDFGSAASEWDFSIAPASGIVESKTYYFDIKDWSGSTLEAEGGGYPLTTGAGFKSPKVIGHAAAGNDYTQNLTETISIADAQAKLSDYGRTVTETLTLTGTADKNATLDRQVTETITASDTQSKLSAYLRSIIESISYADSVSTEEIQALFVNLTETITIADSSVKLSVILRIVTEALSTNDVATKLSNIERIITETPGIGDTQTKLSSYERDATESISAGDTPTREISSSREITDAISANDILTRLVEFYRSFSESISVVDTSAQEETAESTDSVAVFWTRPKHWNKKPPVGSTINWGHPLAKSLMGAWLLNEGGGKTTRNLVSGRKSKVVNPVWKSGKYGQALFTSQTNTTYVDTGEEILDATDERITIVCGVSNFRDLNAGQLFCQKRNTPTNDGYTFSYRGDIAGDPFRFTIQGIVDQNSSATGIIEGPFYQCSVTYDKTHIKFYINNRLLSTHSQNGEIDTSVGNNLFIASSNAGSGEIAVDWEYFYIFNKPLSLSEIRALYEAPYQFIKARRPIFLIQTTADAAGTAHSVNLTDGISISDTPARLGDFYRTVTDSISLASVLSKLVNAFRSTTEAVNINDIATRLVTYQRQATDGISVGDTLGRLVEFYRNITESVNAADQVSRFSELARFITENPGITDLLTKAFDKRLVETITAGDVASRLANITRAIVESLNVQDSVTAGEVGALSVSLIESINVSDSATRLTQLYRNIAEALSINDVYTKLSSKQKELVLSITVNEVITRQVSKILSESIGISEALAKDFVKLLVDTASISDTYSRTAQFFRIFAQAISVSDSTTTDSVSALAKIISQFITPKGIVTTQDLQSMRSDFPLLNTDSLNRMRFEFPQLTTDEINKMARDIQRLLDDWA